MRCQAAANALKLVLPDAVLSAHEMEIPMPGHALGADGPQQAPEGRPAYVHSDFT